MTPACKRPEKEKKRKREIFSIFCECLLICFNRTL